MIFIEQEINCFIAKFMKGKLFKYLLYYKDIKEVRIDCDKFKIIHNSFGRKINFSGCKVYERLRYDYYKIFITCEDDQLWWMKNGSKEMNWINYLLYKSALLWQGDQSFSSWSLWMIATRLLKYLLNIEKINLFEVGGKIIIE